MRSRSKFEFFVSTVSIVVGLTVMIYSLVKLVTIDVQAQAPAIIVPRAEDAPPTTVKIGAMHYTVTLSSEPSSVGDNGNIDTDLLIIRLDNRIPLDKQREVLVHEVLHGCMADYIRFIRPHGDKWADYEPDKTMYVEHSFIEAVSPCLLNTLQQNPKLVKYLVQGTPQVIYVNQ